MIELLFVVCLIRSPEACEERSLLFLARPSPVACMMQAPPELAAWAATHPAYRIASWHCRDPDRRPSSA